MHHSTPTTRSLTLWFSLDRAARITLTFSRLIHGRYRAVLVVSIAAARGADHYSFRTLLARHRLVAGRYRISVQASSAGQRSPAARLAFRIR